MISVRGYFLCKDTKRLKVKDCKMAFYTTGNLKREVIAIIIPDKIDFMT